MNLEDPLLAYVVALTRGEQVPFPESTRDQQDRLLASLQCHWFKPFLYWRIMACPVRLRPPARITEVFESAYFNSLQSSLIVDKQLTGIADAFAEEGVEFLVLKGAALSRTIYPDPFLRPGSDIDIMVRPVDARRARRAMEKAGYTCNYPYFDVSERYFCEEVFTPKDGRTGIVPVEVHWSPTAFPALNENIDIDSLFHRSVPAMAGTRGIRVMDQADAMIYQAVHMIANHFDNVRLTWINDTAFLCRHLTATGGWETFRSRAAESRVGPMLRPALRMAELWTGVSIPQDLYVPDHEAEKKVLGLFDGVKMRRNDITSFASVKWPEGATFFERCRIFKFLALPPDFVMRDEYFPGQDIPLPVMHLKRWAIIVNRHLHR